MNDQKQAWFDFSSGKNGSIFDFVMESEGVSFSGSRRAPGTDGRRAAAAGLARGRGARCAAQDAARRDGARREIFQDTLASRNGAKARGYLADRGLDARPAQRIGYAPGERFALKEHLGSHGIPAEDMVEAGLLISGDDIPGPWTGSTTA